MFAENFSVDVSTNPYPYQMCARYAWLYSWFEIFRWFRLHPFDGFATRNFAFAASCPGNVRQKIQFLNKFHFNLTIFVLLVFHFAVHPVAQGKLFLLQPSRAHNNCITSFRSFRKRARFYVFFMGVVGHVLCEYMESILVEKKAWQMHVFVMREMWTCECEWIEHRAHTHTQAKCSSLWWLRYSKWAVQQ